MVVDSIESHLFHPEIEDYWLLVHQLIGSKRPSLTSFLPKKGKGDREKALNSLSGFDYSQPSSSCLVHVAGMRCSLSRGALCYT
jgi:hypothetical protein